MMNEARTTVLLNMLDGAGDRSFEISALRPCAVQVGHSHPIRRCLSA
jgi:hypothetical protein